MLVNICSNYSGLGLCQPFLSCSILFFCRINYKESMKIANRVANPHLKLQIALTWTIEGITLLTNTIWSDLSALLDLDIPLLSNSFYHQNFKSPTVY